MIKELIGISLGDVTGIGPEIVVKALAAEARKDDYRYLVIGDGAVIERWTTRLRLGLAWQAFEGADSSGRFFWHDPLPERLPTDLASGSPAAAHASLAWLRAGAERCLEGELDALVTAPINKESVLRAGLAFIGQTEFLAHLAGATRFAMMLIGQDEANRWLRVALVTTHLPLKEVVDHLSQRKIEQVVELAEQACRDLGLVRTRVGVCALNPHAGEGGQLGQEELTMIAPAVRAVRERGLDVVGPLAADTLFHDALRGEYDAIVAMYHDQGLVPLKMIAFDTGVNWTLGLPFIRTSPDHGTAYNIAGRGTARAHSMVAAIRLAKRLAGETKTPSQK